MALNTPVKSLSAVSVTGPGTALDNTTDATYHRMTVTMSGYAGTGSVIVALEVAFDSTDAYVPLPSSSQVSLSGNATVVAPFPLSIPYPARLVRANVISWPSTVTGGTVTAWVGSSG
jgi:hypothetical protein